MIQLASTMRNLGRADESVALLTAERDAGSDELDDAVAAFLALALIETGRETQAAALALAALARHLPRYSRSLANYARALCDHPAPTKVRALGEVALRVNDLGAMRRFYEDVLGLTPLGVFDRAVLYGIASGYGGHTQGLALFARGVPVSAQASTVDHIAFTIDRNDFEGERSRLEGLGLKVELAEHAWVHWRSLYVRDPEGNNVELVCYDPAV